jgi:hypothetical protein
VKAGNVKWLVRKNEPLVFLGVEVTNPAKSFGVVFVDIEAMEFDDLIGLYSLRLVSGLRIDPPETEIAFGPDDEKGSGLMNLVEACKVQIASVENVNGSQLYEKFVEKIDLVNFAMGDEDQSGNAASQIQ